MSGSRSSRPTHLRSSPSSSSESKEPPHLRQEHNPGRTRSRHTSHQFEHPGNPLHIELQQLTGARNGANHRRSRSRSGPNGVDSDDESSESSIQPEGSAVHASAPRRPPPVQLSQRTPHSSDEEAQLPVTQTHPTSGSNRAAAGNSTTSNQARGRHSARSRRRPPGCCDCLAKVFVRRFRHGRKGGRNN